MIQRATGLSLLIFTYFLSFSQVVGTDTTETSVVVQNNKVELFTEMSTLNPKKAAFLSAVLPGMGQVYNKQYWKLPFIYGGAVIIGHYVKYQDRLYRSFRSAWIAQNDADPNTVSPYGDVSSEILERSADQIRRDRDYLMIIGGLFYLLQIADAHISAHLHEFTINDDLSMNIGPSIQPSALISRSVGVSISLNFK
ncbi:MAG: hypothetical protein HKN32_00455 [Flavobacteriales bacterium]|nr:hypothetical protein [Flavobacteriales bacterium]